MNEREGERRQSEKERDGERQWESERQVSEKEKNDRNVTTETRRQWVEHLCAPLIHII